MATPEQWLRKLANLRVDRATGDPAPHKPLLVLTILELAERGQLPKRLVPLTPELAFRFFGYWSTVAHRRRQKPDIRLPFHYLQTDGLWSALAEDGNPSSHCRQTRSVALAPDFQAFLEDPSCRGRARHVLVARYFQPSEQLALYELIGTPAPAEAEISRDLDAAARNDAERKGREARFRITVVGHITTRVL